MYGLRCLSIASVSCFVLALSGPAQLVHAQSHSISSAAAKSQKAKPNVRRSAPSAKVKAPVVQRSVAASRVVAPVKASFGQMAGLRSTSDALDLHSSVALVVDQDTHEVLF